MPTGRFYTFVHMFDFCSRHGFIFLLCLTGIIWFSEGCRREEIKPGNGRLTFTEDTLVFDTVFTKAGSGTPKSITHQVIVANYNDEDVVTTIQLLGNEGYFKINVDGISGSRFDEVRIRAGDSIFIFVELFIDPNGDPDSRPLIIRDSILFLTGTHIQQVQLVGWGQDAEYFFNDTIGCNSGWFDTKKPYVVYGYIYVPEGCTFTIGSGVSVHFAPYSWLYVEGTLKIEGTQTNPVRMEGDRLQPAFEEVAGQWGGIWLAFPSVNNVIKHAHIKNGTVGIYCDSIPANASPNLRISHSWVRNMLFDGVAGRMSHIEAENCLLTNCGRYAFLGQWGGEYNLRHCTIATVGNSFSRQEPGLAFTNRRRDELGRILETYTFKASVLNTIVWGNLDQEFGYDLDPAKIVTLGIDGNLMKSKDQNLNKPPLSNILNADPKFKKAIENDFQLDSASPAIDAALILNPPVLLDFNEKIRGAKPDIGALEAQ